MPRKYCTSNEPNDGVRNPESIPETPSAKKRPTIGIPVAKKKKATGWDDENASWKWDHGPE